MSTYDKNNQLLIETLIGIYTIDKGKIKILLMRKKTDPYKGYWILPGSIANNFESLEDNITDTVFERTGIPTLYMEQCHIFSKPDRNPEERIIAATFIGLIDNIILSLRREDRTDIETEWFALDAIPKLGYDHEEIIQYINQYLKKRIVNSNILKLLFPSDFTLPELQRVYEQILGYSLDRRNFRKKFINLGLVEDTGERNEGYNGRPAKLYRFKEEMKEQDLF